MCSHNERACLIMLADIPISAVSTILPENALSTETQKVKTRVLLIIVIRRDTVSITRGFSKMRRT